MIQTVRWPWTRTDVELTREIRKTEDTRLTMRVLLGRLESVLNRLDETLEEHGDGLDS